MNDKLQLQGVRTWFDPMDMFRQIAPDGVVKKEAVDKSLSPGDALDSETKVEIDQAVWPAEGAQTRPLDQKAAPDAQKLLDAVGCPFAGHDGKEATAPYDSNPAVGSSPSSGDGSEWSKIEHPKAPLSESTIEILKSGEQEGAGTDPYLS